MGVVTLLKVSSPPTTRLPARVPGENPIYAFTRSDNDNTIVVVSLLRASFWNTGCLEWAAGGAEFIYDDDDHGSWRRGAARTRRRSCDDGLVQGEGADYRRAGVDDMLCMVFASITPEYGSVEDGGGGFQRAHVVRVECWLDWLVLPARRWAAW